MALFAKCYVYGSCSVHSLPHLFSPQSNGDKTHIPNYSQTGTSTMFSHLLIKTSLSHMTVREHIFT